MSFPYEDILHIPRPQSRCHARMSDADRAAQFSPFAALNGHQDAIRETARLTGTKAELDESEQERLNEQFRALARRLPEGPQVTVTCFFPDEKKQGGAYVTLTGTAKKLDEYEQVLQLEDGTRLPLGDILTLTLAG